MTTTSIINGQCFPKLDNITIDRQHTSLERLCKRLMARAMSSRRPFGTRVVALGLLVPAGLAALAGKLLERLPDVAGKVVGVGIAGAIVGYALLTMVKADPALLDLLRQALSWIGHRLIEAAG